MSEPGGLWGLQPPSQCFMVNQTVWPPPQLQFLQFIGIDYAWYLYCICRVLVSVALPFLCHSMKMFFTTLVIIMHACIHALMKANQPETADAALCLFSWFALTHLIFMHGYHQFLVYAHSYAFQSQLNAS